MKKINIALRVILALLLFIPILGTLGLFPAPTRDLYNSDQGFNFIMILMESGYVMWMMSVVFLFSIILIFKNRMAIVALLLLPITLNIIGFHMFLDGGIFTGGAVMGNVLLLINLYFLYQNKDKYRALV